MIGGVQPPSSIPQQNHLIVVIAAYSAQGQAVLTGVLVDQAALYGVLAQAEGLGLELIDVRRLPPDEPREPTL